MFSVGQLLEQQWWLSNSALNTMPELPSRCSVLLPRDLSITQKQRTNWPVNQAVFCIFDGLHGLCKIWLIHEFKYFFVIRPKSSFQLERQYSGTVDKSKKVKCDRTDELKGFYVFKHYLERVRSIRWHDAEEKNICLCIQCSEEIAAV